VDKFKEQNHIHCHYGDSAEGLQEILPEITQPVVFWLDAHYSGPGTAHGIEEVPLLRELEVISKRRQKDIIIIDDAYLFGKRRWGEGGGDYRAYEQNWEDVTLESITKAIHLEPNSLMVRHNNNLLLIFTNLTVSDALQIGESRINELNQLLSSKELRINELNNELSQIRLSITWRTFKKIHHIIDLIIPVGAKRRSLASLALSRIRTYYRKMKMVQISSQR